MKEILNSFLFYLIVSELRTEKTDFDEYFNIRREIAIIWSYEY